MSAINETHDPKLSSWVKSADKSDFPIQNLPYGVFARAQADAQARIGVAIGDHVLDLKACVQKGLFSSLSQGLRNALEMPALNGLMSLGQVQWSSLRSAVSALLRTDSKLACDSILVSELLVPMTDAKMLLPAEIPNYTDFYASLHHATSVGKLFRPESPLFPNYKYVPIAYHGRASSVVVSGEQIVRPRGQVKASETEPPEYRPTKSLDFELELGVFIGPGNPRGVPITIGHAEEHLFGFCLLNDWSARDIQKWEYQPLGPFLGKNFATSISAWVVTTEALAPFRSPAQKRPEGDPAPLPYLHSDSNQATGSFDIQLQSLLFTRKMRLEGDAPIVLGTSNAKDLYWTPAQFVTQHTSNGCNLVPGDLFGSGTVSGAGSSAHGCLLERTQGGKVAVELPNGETRKFLDDGDELILTGRAVRAGAVSIGFGRVTGEVVPENH